MLTRGEQMSISYLDKQLSKRDRRRVIRYMKQYNNMNAIIESRKLDLMPSITSTIKESAVQESNEFKSEAEEYTEKAMKLDELYIKKKKLDEVYKRAKPIHRLIWDEHFIDGRMDADIYYGNDITKRTYYREKNELILVVAECLGIGTK